jgi:4-hydroxy-tetrahydrodipicolinate reductase
VTRVAVFGAAGRMGRTVCQAVEADPDLELVARVDPNGGEGIVSDPQAALDAGAEVIVDFTTPASVAGNIRWALEHGVHIVVGTTGISPADLDEVRSRADGTGSNVFVAPNFAIGAVLMQSFARQAAKWFPAVEVIELHHDGKLDAPSGTAASTARMIAQARDEAWTGPGGETVEGVRGGAVEGVPVHSVRLPGLVAHQEVIFGGLGQVLTIRHDSLARESFMPGVLLAVKRVGSLPGLTVGLEALLED